MHSDRDTRNRRLIKQSFEKPGSICARIESKFGKNRRDLKIKKTVMERAQRKSARDATEIVAHVRSGSNSAVRRCPAQCLVCPKAVIERTIGANEQTTKTSETS